MRDDGREVLELAPALVVHAFRLADATEVRPPRLVAQLDEGPRKRLHHLVVEAAAKERMRVRDQRHAERRAGRVVDRAFDPARRTGDELATGTRAHRYIRRRSTIRPCLRCCSMISSMSSRST